MDETDFDEVCAASMPIEIFVEKHCLVFSFEFCTTVSVKTREKKTGTMTVLNFENNLYTQSTTSKMIEKYSYVHTKIKLTLFKSQQNGKKT